MEIENIYNIMLGIENIFNILNIISQEISYCNTLDRLNYFWDEGYKNIAEKQIEDICKNKKIINNQIKNDNINNLCAYEILNNESVDNNFANIINQSCKNGINNIINLDSAISNISEGIANKVVLNGAYDSVNNNIFYNNQIVVNTELLQNIGEGINNLFTNGAKDEIVNLKNSCEKYFDMYCYKKIGFQNTDYSLARNSNYDSLSYEVFKENNYDKLNCEMNKENNYYENNSFNSMGIGNENYVSSKKSYNNISTKSKLLEIMENNNTSNKSNNENKNINIDFSGMVNKFEGKEDVEYFINSITERLREKIT